MFAVNATQPFIHKFLLASKEMRPFCQRLCIFCSFVCRNDESGSKKRFSHTNYEEYVHRAETRGRPLSVCSLPQLTHAWIPMPSSPKFLPSCRHRGVAVKGAARRSLTSARLLTLPCFVCFRPRRSGRHEGAPHHRPLPGTRRLPAKGASQRRHPVSNSVLSASETCRYSG